MNSELESFPLTKKFGERLRARRREIGLNQSDLAFAVGVNRRVIGRLERGVGTIRLETALRAARELGLEIDLGPREQ